MRQVWQLWEGALSPQRCNELIKICREECAMQDGTIFSQTDLTTNSSVRDTQIGWTHNSEIKDIVDYYYKEANRNAFSLDASYIPSVQYGEYREGSFYSWHHDINWSADTPYDRKLSVVIQLTDPAEYEGGKFEFKHVETPENFITQGSILVFPSYLEHQVTRVSKGLRRSLVAWVEGPRWR